MFVLNFIGVGPLSLWEHLKESDKRLCAGSIDLVLLALDWLIISEHLPLRGEQGLFLGGWR